MLRSSFPSPDSGGPARPAAHSDGAHHRLAMPSDVPVAIVRSFRAVAAGAFEVNRRPTLSPAAQNLGAPHETASIALLTSTSAIFQAPGAAAGLVLPVPMRPS